jgi:uncharacterized protein (TIGR03437 family)
VSPSDDEPFDVVAIDPSNSKSIYVGTDSGLWHSSDGAVTWQKQGPVTGMPNAPVYDIKINPTTNRTVVFTYGRGAYALGLSPADLPPLLIGGPSSPANGATYIAGGLVPGSWAQVLGTNLSSVTRTWNDSDFIGLGNQLPTTLSGVQVQVECGICGAGTQSVNAAVYYVSPTQVSFQVPSGILSGPPGDVLYSTPVNVQLFRDGLGSNILTAAGTTSSGIFPIIVNGQNYPAGVFLDGELTGDPVNGAVFRKATPGDVIQLFATGLFRTTSGVAGQTQTYSDVTVTIGDVTVAADAAVLVAPGEFQINFTVPQQFASLPEGNYPISIQYNGAIGTSSPVTINSIPPGPLILPIQH